MASNNNDNSGAALVFGLVGAAIYFMMIFLVALGVVMTIGLTVISIAAWNRPLRVGKWVVTPQEAQDFIGRGVVGSLAFPILAVLCDLFFATNIITLNNAILYQIAGYCLGSLGVEMLLNSDGDRTPGPLIEYLPPPQPSRQIPEPRETLPIPTREPFRYASWDDEV